MANKKRKQKQTLKEFRAWLQGVEELQPDNWSPNQPQWKLIRERIDGIIEEKIVEKVVKKEAVPEAPIYRNSPSVYDAPQQPSSIPAGAINAEMTPAAKKMLSPGPGEKAKTPHIDASAGPVDSSFA